MKKLTDGFPLKGNKKELLNKTDEPIKKVVVYKFDGKKKTIKPRCELCAFCEIVEDEDLSLLCLKKSQIVDDEHSCDEFNITREMLQDIYDGCVK